MYYVYSLKCKDGFYVGCTKDIIHRLDKHKTGQVQATFTRLPIKLEFFVAFTERHKAYYFERYLKSGSGRSFVKRHLA